MSTQEADSNETDAEAGTFGATVGSEPLKTMLDALRAVNDEAVIGVDSDGGLDAHVVDPGNVLMVNVSVPPEAFESFSGNGLTLGVDVEKVADFALVGDVAHIEWDRDDWRLRIGSGPVDVALGTIDPSSVRQKDVNEDAYDSADVTFEMPYDDLKTALTATTKLGTGTVAEVVATDDFVGLKKSGDTDSITAGFDSVSGGLDGADVSTLMDESYLTAVKQAIPSDTEVTITTDDEWPVFVEYEHAGVSVRFIQAPRIPAQ